MSPLCSVRFARTAPRGRTTQFAAKVSADGESVDAGDNIHVGRWHPAGPPEQKDDWVGIKWKDGNRWIKKKA